MYKNNKFQDDDSFEQIAVIGMAGSFPGADTIDKFWNNLRCGVESIFHLSDDDLKTQAIPKEWLQNPKFVKVGTHIEHFDEFDADFFGYSPREASITDPQQRLFLETAWEALENAGYSTEHYDGLIGVFAGVGVNKYIFNLHSQYSQQNDFDEVSKFQELMGNDKDYLATRVSYKLNLRGPSLTIQTACSTSLVAAHIACQSLLTYQCDIALTGGVCLNPSQRRGYLYQEGMILSPDGHCRAFDANAKGIVPGQGVGIVVLKRLSDAFADGDTIHAVIKGSAVNNDGSKKVGYTAPSVDGQSEVIITAQSMAQTDPETITYIEAHGTGTQLGDPIEIAALTQAFRVNTQKKGFCAVGSVKTNIGHLDAAAGVAGLIKTILALKYKEIPPSLHFEKPNPEIDFDNSPFFVNTQLTKWASDGIPRRAGVSSFGIGGTNAHVILEEAPPIEPSSKSRPWQILLLSAKTATALDKMTSNLSEYLEQNPSINLADVAYTLQVGRKIFNHRRTVLCQENVDALNSLKIMDPERVKTSSEEPTHRDIVFMFSGQGSQYVNMGSELYGTESTFREEVDKCSDILKRHLNFDLRDILYPNNQNAQEATEKLIQTSITQPVLFVIEYALSKLWMSWGIHPKAMVGHSIGEYVAACLSGIFSLEDALSIVARRGALMGSLPPGAMSAVFLAEKEVRPLLPEEVSIALVNGPSLCVISGETEAVEELERNFSAKKIECRRLHTSHAFHSRMIEPILDAFAEEVKKINLSFPTQPFLSNVSGTWITDNEATDPNYWVKHLRQTVRFSDCLEELFHEPGRVLFEVGPGQSLSILAKQHPSCTERHIVLPTMRHPNEKTSDRAFIMNTVGQLWLCGAALDWPKLYEGERRLRIPLPTYPFERKRHWLELQDFLRIPTKKGVPGEEHERTIELAHSNQIEEEARPGGEKKHLPGREEIILILAGIWEELLGVSKINEHDNFFELGGQSLIAIRLFSKIENKFGKRLPLAVLFKTPTIAQLADLLVEDQFKPSWGSLVGIQTQGNRPPFFCVHSEGGNVLEYQRLSEYLGQQYPFYALQAQGLEGKKAEKMSVGGMASNYIQEIKNLQPAGPYYIGGYCLGGVVAFEMARQLEEEGNKIGLLAMISSSTPQHARNNSHDIAVYRRWFYRFLERAELEMSNMSVLEGKKKMAYLKDRISRVWLVLLLKVEDFNGWLYSRLMGKPFKHSRPYILEKMRAYQNEAFFEYKPLPIKTPIFLFRTSKRPRHLSKDPTLGWKHLANGGIQDFEIKAFHRNILKDPHVMALAVKLRECIESAQNVTQAISASGRKS